MVRQNKPQLVFLMETKCHRGSDSRVKRETNFENCFEIPSAGKSGGLMLLWNNDMDIMVQSFSAGHIDVVVRKDSNCWRFTGMYGHPVDDRRWETWELLHRLHRAYQLP